MENIQITRSQFNRMALAFFLGAEAIACKEEKPKSPKKELGLVDICEDNFYHKLYGDNAGKRALLIEFYSPSCEPGKPMDRMYEAASKDPILDLFIFGRCLKYENPKLSIGFGVAGVPTLAISYPNGKSEILESKELNDIKSNYGSGMTKEAQIGFRDYLVRRVIGQSLDPGFAERARQAYSR